MNCAVLCVLYGVCVCWVVCVSVCRALCSAISAVMCACVLWFGVACSALRAVRRILFMSYWLCGAVGSLVLVDLLLLCNSSSIHFGWGCEH